MVTEIIDCDYDGYIEADEADSETGTTVIVFFSSVSTNHSRGYFRFPLSALPASASVSDTTIQFNITAEDIEAGEGLDMHSYAGDGATDPETDTAADKYTNAAAGAARVLIDCSSTGSKSGDLGTTVDAEVAANIDSPDFWSLGMSWNGFETGEDARPEAIENAGTDPATLTVVYTSGPEEVALTANQPASAAVLAVLYKIAVAASQPAQTATLAAALLIVAPQILANQPASTAALTFLYRIALAASQPAQSADLTVQYLLANLGADQPASTATVTVQYQISLAANQPAQSADFDLIKYLVALLANQPASTATVISTYVIALTANQPAQSAAVVLTWLVALTANQPAQTAAFAIAGQVVRERGDVSGGFLREPDMRSLPGQASLREPDLRTVPDVWLRSKEGEIR